VIKSVTFTAFSPCLSAVARRNASSFIMMNPTDQKIVDEVGMIYATAFNHHRPLRRETTLLLKGLEGKKVRASALVPAARRCCTAFWSRISQKHAATLSSLLATD
jgi:hypothetical protein